MSADEQTKIACRSCGKQTPAGQSLCEHCRQTQMADAQPAEHPLRQWVDNQWAVLALLFFVTAGCGLPVLWASRGFTPWAKVLLTVIMIAYTALILWLIGVMLLWIGQSFSEAWRAFS